MLGLSHRYDWDFISYRREPKMAIRSMPSSFTKRRRLPAW
jgi:hypothetical protein